MCAFLAPQVLSLVVLSDPYCAYLNYVHLCEAKDQDKTKKKIKCSSATLASCHVCRLLGDAMATRHHQSVSGAKNFVPHLSV